jgi:hypothetical protein
VLIVDEYYYLCHADECRKLADQLLCAGGAVFVFVPWQRTYQWFAAFMGCSVSEVSLKIILCVVYMLFSFVFYFFFVVVLLFIVYCCLKHVTFKCNLSDPSLLPQSCLLHHVFAIAYMCVDIMGA